MSMGESDAKFPNQTGTGLPPSPTRENPGQVFPKSDPEAAPPQSVPGTGVEHKPIFVKGNEGGPKESAAKAVTTQEGPMFTD